MPDSAYTVGQMKNASAHTDKGDAQGLPVDDADPWRELDGELDAWRHAGLTAAFWWRDDDATRPGPMLDRLLAIAGTRPLALAVIPKTAAESLAVRLAEHNRGGGTVFVLQHGYAHLNHAPPAARRAEFGEDRPLAVMLDELGRGRRRMEALFGEIFEPILTPPWNRIGDTVAGALEAAGLRGLSGFGPRALDAPDKLVNTHIDIIDWRGDRGFVGERRALAAAVRHLAARRTGTAAPGEPTGLLTHHRDHDAPCWRFIEAFAAAIDAHPAARWVLP